MFWISGCDCKHHLAVSFLAVTEGSYVVFHMGAADLRSHEYYHCYKVIVQGKVLTHFRPNIIVELGV